MTYADRVPAPRPVPTTRERMTDARACGHTPEQHRHDDGQAADDRSKDRAIAELTIQRDNARSVAHAASIERDEAHAEITDAWAAINAAGRPGPHSIAGHITRLADELHSTQQVATFRQDVIDRHAAELTAAGHVVNAVRTGTLEDIERALARFDTQPEVTPVEADTECPHLAAIMAGKIYDAHSDSACAWCADIRNKRNGEAEAEAPLGSVSPRAQDDLADRLAAVVVHLMRLNGGEGVTTSTWQTWEALLAEVGHRKPHGAAE